MTKEEILTALYEKDLTDIIKLIQDAEEGFLEELELVEQVGLVNDSMLDKEVIQLLKDLNVKIIYVTYDEEDEEEEN